MDLEQWLEREGPGMLSDVFVANEIDHVAILAKAMQK